jgi:hypothetical protein
MNGACSTHGVCDKCIQQFRRRNLSGREFRRPKHRWDDNIWIGLKEIGCGLDSKGPGEGPVAGWCEYKNLRCVRGKEFLWYLSDYWLLKDSVPWDCLGFVLLTWIQQLISILLKMNVKPVVPYINFPVPLSLRFITEIKGSPVIETEKI